MRWKAVVFDLDNTLYDADQAYEVALRGVGIDPLGSAFQEARSRVKKRLLPGHVSARNRVLYFKELFESSGEFSPSRIIEEIEKYEGLIRKNLKSQWAFLERNKLFDELSKRLKIFVLTNENTRMQLFKLASLDPLGKYFHHVVTSEELGVEKPDKKLFLETLNRLNLNPHECLMVGDEVSSDLWPAHGMGMATAWTQEFIKKDLNNSREQLPPGCMELFKLNNLENILLK